MNVYRDVEVASGPLARRQIVRPWMRRVAVVLAVPAGVAASGALFWLPLLLTGSRLCEVLGVLSSLAYVIAWASYLAAVGLEIPGDDRLHPLVIAWSPFVAPVLGVRRVVRWIRTGEW